MVDHDLDNYLNVVKCILSHNSVSILIKKKRMNLVDLLFFASRMTAIIS